MKRALFAIAAAVLALFVGVGSGVVSPNIFRRDGTGTVRFDARPFPGRRVTLWPEAHAARNGSGTFSLYTPGNPVTTSTNITSSWANNTMNDLATEVTDSLSRSGKGGMLSALRLVNGSVGAPAISFTSETNSGLYRAGASDIRFAVAGVDVQTWAAALITLALPTKVSGAGQTTASVTTTSSLGGSLGLSDTGTSVNNGGMLLLGNSQGYWASLKGLLVDGSSNTKGDLVFSLRTAVADATLTEKLRIAADGTLTAAGNLAFSGSSPTVTANGSNAGLTIKGNRTPSGAPDTTADVTIGSTGTRTGGDYVLAFKNNAIRMAQWDSFNRLVFNDTSSAAQIIIDPTTGSAQISMPGAGSSISGVQTYGLTSTLFASLGAGSNGALKYCSDCTIANPCAGGGTGAIAKRLNGVWVCN